MEFDEKGVGKAGAIRFRPDWAWCASPEFRKLLLGGPEHVTAQEVCSTSEPVKNQEVCAPPVTPDLVQRQKEEETKKEGRDTHNPQEMTGCSSAVEYAKFHLIEPGDADCVTHFLYGFRPKHPTSIAHTLENQRLRGAKAQLVAYWSLNCGKATVFKQRRKRKYL